MNRNAFLVLLFILYILAMTAIMVWQGIGIAPDRYALVLLVGSVLVKRTRSFVLDFLPFLFILISYDFLRGLAPFLNQNVHYQELIDAEVWIFGSLPTVVLQDLFFTSGKLALHDYLATIVYFLHFALPLGFGFLLWIKSKFHFREFALGILLLSYAGWISFVIYPASPPWLAYEKGYISGVTKILNETLTSFPERLNLPTIYHNFNPNKVAAMPSMHAAYPVLILLFALSYFGLKGLIITPYVAAVFVSLVYLGEHYVIDEIAGAIYALIFFIVAKLVTNKVKFLSPLSPQ